MARLVSNVPGVSDAQIVDEPLWNDVFTRMFGQGIGAE
jgi:hypothetical protein